MKYSDIFKIRPGSWIRGLIGTLGPEDVLVMEVGELTLRADCKKFSVSFRDDKNRLWYVSETSKAELL